MKKNILITTSSFGKYDKAPLEMLENAGLSYALNPHGRKITSEELLALVGESVGIVAGTEDINASVLEKLKNVKVISRCGVGLDSVDLEKAKELSIVVRNTPDSVTNPVAELTVGLILGLLRQINLCDHEIKNGQWNKRMGNLLSGKKAGIIGFGRIGKHVGQLLSAFGAEIYFNDIAVTKSDYAKYLELDDLLKQVDIICLHIPGQKDKGYLIDKKEIDMIKQGAWFVNCSRGGTVNEEALLEALKDKRLSGAAIDVFESEPYKGPLVNQENVILTPHIGSYAKEARIQMEIEAVENLIDALGK